MRKLERTLVSWFWFSFILYFPEIQHYFAPHAYLKLQHAVVILGPDRQLLVLREPPFEVIPRGRDRMHRFHD
jgi:hypothetical protein